MLFSKIRSLRLIVFTAVFVFMCSSIIFMNTASPSMAAGYQGLSGAQNTLTAGQNVSGGAKGDLPTLIGNIIGIILSVLGVILVVIIVQAGILYMTAAGDTAKVDKAKKMITQAIVGMVLIVAAYSISTFVINQLEETTKGPLQGDVPGQSIPKDTGSNSEAA